MPTYLLMRLVVRIRIGQLCIFYISSINYPSLSGDGFEEFPFGFFRGGGGRRGGGRGGRGRGHSDRDHGRDSEGGHGKHKRFNEGQDGGNNAKNQKTEWIDMMLPPFLVDGWDTWRLFRDLCPSFTTILLRCLFFGCNANSPKLLIYLREKEIQLYFSAASFSEDHSYRLIACCVKCRWWLVMHECRLVLFGYFSFCTHFS